MKFLLCVLALPMGATVVQAAPVAQLLTVPVVAEPLAEKDGLKVSIGSIELLATEPHVDVVLQNVSAKPIELPTEISQQQTDGLVLEITKLGDKTLDKKIVVASKNRFMALHQQGQTDLIAPGEVIVREIYLQESKNAEAAPKRTSFGSEFPLPNEDGKEHLITMRVMFTNSKSDSMKSAWSGCIASGYKEYNLYWKRGPYIKVGPNVAF